MPDAPNSPPLSRTDSAAVAALAESLGLHLEERLAELLDERLTPAGPPPLLDVNDVAARLKVSARTVERIVNAGHLRPIWIEGQRRFTSAAVEAYLKAAARRKGR